jgi:hypothetical protein
VICVIGAPLRPETQQDGSHKAVTRANGSGLLGAPKLFLLLI